MTKEASNLGQINSSFDPSTVMRRVYNSTDQRDPDGMGPGWRLSVSDVTAGLEGVAGMVSDLDVGAGLTVANLVDDLGVVTGRGRPDWLCSRGRADVSCSLRAQ